MTERVHECCAVCQFFIEHVREGRGGNWMRQNAGCCRRRAPERTGYDNNLHQAEQAWWPYVLASNWCGEFQVRPECKSAVIPGPDRSYLEPLGRPVEDEDDEVA